MLVLFLFSLAWQQPVQACDGLSSALAHAREVRRQGGLSAAAAQLASVLQHRTPCVEASIAGWASTGWLEARATASGGGAKELLGPARSAIETLSAISARSRTWRVQSEYARAAITAAIAASQDERPEMLVYLVHARSLSDRLQLVGEEAEWPMPIDEIEGELWLEVDRYAEARAAYQRAIERSPHPSAWIGLARANHELGNSPAACEAYARASERAGGPLAAEARVYQASHACEGSRRSRP